MSSSVTAPPAPNGGNGNHQGHCSRCHRVWTLKTGQGFSRGDAEALRQELRGLRERNLKEATFEEKVDLVAMLGIKVYPSEDLKSRRIVCRLNLKKVVGEREQNDFAKVFEPSTF
ncbi:MAG: hypothetical protein HYU83_00095 [Chloroflexi bacterium]|nr:hypothetical protein [Chloroflexota bacterium]